MRKSLLHFEICVVLFCLTGDLHRYFVAAHKSNSAKQFKITEEEEMKQGRTQVWISTDNLPSAPFKPAWPL